MKTRTVKIANSDWKFLALIEANVSFEDEIYNYKTSAIRILNDIEEVPNGMYLVEVYTKRREEKNISFAYYKSIDLLNEFLDQISFISFQKAFIKSPIAITYAYTSFNKSFPMLHIHPSIVRKKIKIQKGDLTNPYHFDERKHKYYNLLRLLKYYQNAERQDDKYLYLYSAIDFIADLESTELQVKKCTSCGHSVTLDSKATGNYIKELATHYKIENFNINKFRGVRAKIAHGSSKRDFSFFADLNELIPKLETLAYKVLRDRLGVDIKLLSNIHCFTPRIFLEGKCIPISEEILQSYPEAKNKKHFYTIVSLKMDHSVQFSSIHENQNPESYNTSDFIAQDNTVSSKNDDIFDGSFGIDFSGDYGNVPLSPYAWPYSKDS
jgi:hypothetical protein